MVPTPRRSIGKYLQRIVFDRDGHRCRICGKPEFTIDHFNSLARGGTNAPSNLWTLCQGCNSAKGALPPRIGIGRALRRIALMHLQSMR